jgi:hypothetical protein
VYLTRGHGASVMSEEDNLLLRPSLVAAPVSSCSMTRSTQRDSRSGAHHPVNFGSCASRACIVMCDRGPFPDQGAGEWTWCF